MVPAPPDPIDAFIARWTEASGAERSNSQTFLAELCDVLGVARPAPVTDRGGDYRFERPVTHHEADGTARPRFIDLYRRGRFVLEAKQGTAAPQPSLLPVSETERRTNIRRSPGWAQAMLRARGQAEGYARDLPAEEGYPPFLIVCDIGFCFDLYADFSGTGKHYAQFPDREGFRLYLPDLRDPAVRERLRLVWEDPHALDPARKRVRVTREIAALLARLAQALEAKGHAPQSVATFLMRCIFCMFAQSVGLLPTPSAFTDLLEESRADLHRGFVTLLANLWNTMDAGGYSAALRAAVWRFNGGLFAAGVHGPVEPLPIDSDMLDLLVMAAKRDWKDVEPAIFGTLLENALSDRQRGELGAHFTPREFVERLVLPTVMEPLRAEWDGMKVAAGKLADTDRAGAAGLVAEFHARLCQLRVLDPACGTGNFLYVTLELMKRLEGEVLDLLADLAPGEGDRLALSGASVDPHQFLGIEKNPRAVPVAELVLWIGWLQWHFRTRGSAPPAEPILRDFHNIREGDSLLAYAREDPERDAHGAPVSRWDGRTFKRHPITGEGVPDETARVLVLRPVGAKPAVWPDAEFIIGNPPFIAGKDLRAELGEGYAKALWAAYPKVPRSADLALFFWWKAADRMRAPKSSLPLRFGFITSNTIRQTFCRRVLAEALSGPRRLHLVFAIPDHPWADGDGAAAVRIAMTVAERLPPRGGAGRLLTVTAEQPVKEGAPAVVLAERYGTINADLTVGTDVTAAQPLHANEGICSPGVKLHGAGFMVSPATARALGLGRVPGLERHIRPYLNGRDLTQHSRGQMVIDLDGLNEQQVRRRFPDVYQHLLLHVKPERDHNNEKYRRENW